jgi:N-acetylglucosaminyl-diphospho-decaprenol L-rhamnosyltransferase
VSQGDVIPDVRVGIVSWNTAGLLDRCLAALPEALGELDAEVVVVDNASDDDSAGVVRARGVTLVENPVNEGYARAMNQALDGTGAPVLIALNPDTAPPPGSLAALVARLHEHPSVGVLVPRLVDDDGRLQHSAYRFPSPSVAAVVSFVPPRWQRGAIGRRWWLEGGAPHDQSETVDWAIGAVHVLRRAALDGRPPYSERWFMYAEDIEVCWRLGQRGWSTMLAADITIPHHGNAAGAQAWGSTRSTRYWAATYDLYAGMHGALAARWLAMVNVAGVTYHLVGNALGSLPRTGARTNRQAAARDLARILPLHARALVLGPRRLARTAGVRAGAPARYAPA